MKCGISLPILVFYGLDNILGAGIYVLIGEVSAAAGTYVPLAFLLSAIIAGFTAFTYAELSARFPENSGEAIYIYNGLGHQGPGYSYWPVDLWRSKLPVWIRFIRTKRGYAAQAAWKLYRTMKLKFVAQF